MSKLEPYQIVRELLAGTLFLLNIYLGFSFACRAKRELQHHEMSWKVWRSDPTAMAATALAIYFLGALVLRGWDWVLVKLNNLNVEFDYPAAEYLIWTVRQSWWVTVVFGAVVLIGGLCCVRVFNPDRKAYIRLVAVALVAVFVPLLVFLGFHGWPG